jgi:DNA-binding phage protein
MNNQQIADLSGMQRSNVSRFFAAKGSAPHFDTFLKIASAIGVKITLKNKK